MGYVFAVIGFLALIMGIMGKTGNRSALLRLPGGLDRAIFIYCGAMFLVLGTFVILGRLKL